MANTPQAKKRIRRNANRAEINGARVSRIRTFVKAVESAIDAGNKDRRRGAEEGQPEMARGVARGVLHKNTASRKFSRLTKAGCGARLSASLPSPVETGRRHAGGPFLFDDRKSRAFPRFACANRHKNGETAVFKLTQFGSFPCQAVYFTLVKIALESRAQALSKHFPAASPAGGHRVETGGDGAATRAGAQRFLRPVQGSVMRRRAPVQG